MLTILAILAILFGFLMIKIAAGVLGVIFKILFGAAVVGFFIGLFTRKKE